MLPFSRVVTHFYIESFISKELEVRLHQNINYPVHSHLGDKKNGPAAAGQDMASQFGAAGGQQDGARRACKKEQEGSVMLMLPFPPWS